MNLTVVSIVVIDESTSDQWLIPFPNPNMLHLEDLITIADKEYVVTARKWVKPIDGPFKLIFYVSVAMETPDSHG